MKWAEANTRLSFVTATLNSLWAATPPSFQQHHVDGRARQVRRGAGVQRVGLVAELPVQRGGRVPTRHGPDAARGEHGASAALYGDRRIGAELAGDVGVRRRREERQIDLDDRLPPGEPVGQRAAEPGDADLERRLEIGSVLAGDRSAAAARPGPIAGALARKSSYVASRKDANGETLPGLGALASSRQASCAAAATSAACRAGGGVTAASRVRADARRSLRRRRWTSLPASRAIPGSRLPRLRTPCRRARAGDRRRRSPRRPPWRRPAPTRPAPQAA